MMHALGPGHACPGTTSHPIGINHRIYEEGACQN